MKKSQTQRVLDHLIDHGYITDIVARNYGIKRLASRMNELKGRAVGFRVEYRMDDAGVRYAYYWLPNDRRDAERSLRDDDGVSWNGKPMRAAA